VDMWNLTSYTPSLHSISSGSKNNSNDAELCEIRA